MRSENERDRDKSLLISAKERRKEGKKERKKGKDEVKNIREKKQ